MASPGPASRPLDSNLLYWTYSRQQEHGKPCHLKHIIDLHIPDFSWLLHNQTNRDIRTKRYKLNEALGKWEKLEFLTKIKLSGCNNYFIEVYYMAQNTVFIERLHLNDRSSVSSPSLIINKESHLAEKNKWHILAVEFKKRKASCDGLKLHFEFIVIQTNKTGIVRELPSQPQLEDSLGSYSSNPKLKNDVINLLLNPAFADVTIKSADGDEIPAHKVFLVTSSKVFKAHFEHDTVEKHTNIIESPFESVVIQDMLSFMYISNVPNICQTAKKLLAAADFYQVDNLKRMCEITLQDMLNVKNAIEILVLADLHGATHLKERVLEFIHDGDHARDVLRTEGWKTLQSIELVKCLYEYSLINN